MDFHSNLMRVITDTEHERQSLFILAKYVQRQFLCEEAAVIWKTYILITPCLFANHHLAFSVLGNAQNRNHMLEIDPEVDPKIPSLRTLSCEHTVHGDLDCMKRDNK